MPGFVDEVMGDAPTKVLAEYSVLKQRVDLDIDFATQSLKGSTEITIQPLVKDLQHIRLHCRQCKPTAIQAGGITAKYEYDDPYRKLRMPGQATVHQHEMLKSKLVRSLQPAPEPELAITLPAKLKIQELHLDPTSQLPQYNGTPSLERQETDAMAIAEMSTAQVMAQQQGPQFAPIKLFIEFEVSDFRDGLHWIGCDDGDKRYPSVYTKGEPWAGNTSCIFPCIDDATSRCSWELSVRCPRTLGDAFKVVRTEPEQLASLTKPVLNGSGVDRAKVTGPAEQKPLQPEYMIELGEEEAALDLSIVCVGEQIDDIADADDETRHTVTFSLVDPVTARHIGFAVGPFDHVDLSSTRATDDEERLGRSAVRVDGYCLPGRGREVRNTCFPITRAIDHFGVLYGSFPFSNYQILFVDDLIHDTVAAAGLSICNSHLLFPEEIIEPLETNTRIIIRTVADQWMGVNVVAKEPTDEWIVAGIAGYMSDLYGKSLFGNNAYRWQQKLAAEKVYEMDADRPSIHQHGLYLHLDPSVREFLDLKSALVLFILDRRLLKVSGTTGIHRIINKVFLNAKTGSLENGELSTADFQRTCERLSHVSKLDPFFKQWVFGAGCPIFSVSQKFNKKKLVVEMQIAQRQMDRQTKPEFAPSNFMREMKEHIRDVWAPEVQPVFTGPMTIRIHEADGTPYEHIVEIKEQITKLEIPYNTKYKRLKRSRRQKERAMADGNTGEGGEEALLYCLGDILDTPEEIRDWNLVDWTEDDEEKMGQESYEWIRMDADFEWIGKMHLVMPLYMYISQLQQDRDLVAQYESMRYLMGSNPHHVSLSILVRTLMDRRYFHGIRTMAAEGLAILAKGDGVREIGQFHLQKAFEEMFCFPGEIMPKPNDWSDRVNYNMQCAIPRAMTKLRDAEEKVPMIVRRFFIDKLRFNDNSDNEFSDCHYVATLMECLADALVTSHREIQPAYTFSFGEEEPMEPENPDEPFEHEAIDLIERRRRFDEIVTTYHNIYSITALDCLQKLTKAGIVKDKTKEVLQYTRSGNADLVRLEAFKCLTETGLTRKMSMLRYLLQSIADDRSPFFRNRLTAICGVALGHIAFGDGLAARSAALAPQLMETDGLVLEQETSNAVRALEAIRKTTPEGAIAALKLALSNEAAFKEALWYAATSPDMTLDEVAGFCDIAALLYVPVSSCTITLQLPRKYRCEHLGKCKLRFVPHGPYRRVPNKELPVDDWEMIQGFGLKYSGPVVTEVIPRRRSSIEDEMALSQRVAELQPQAMLPPPPPPQPPAVVPEKSGFKLSLGGGQKRKSSVDLSNSRAGSPKAQKTSKIQTPGGSARSPPPPKRSPSVASQRRGSTPSAKTFVKKQGKKIVRLRLSASGMAKAQNITSAIPHRGRGMAKSTLPHPADTSTTPSPSVRPGLPLHSPVSFPHPQSLLPSPTTFLSPLQSPSLNIGSFRSYGPAPDPPIPAVKQESITANVSPLNGVVKKAAPILSSASPVDDGNRTMLPPPPPAQKPKLKLKLGRKPSGTGSAGSPPA